MSRRWLATTIRALPVLVVVGACLGAVAYAATGPGRGEGFTTAADERPRIRAKGPRPGSPRPPRPLIVRHPLKMSATTTANFAFRLAAAAASGLRFQCRLDHGAWKSCRSPLALSGLAAGDHSFSVRAVARRGHGAATRFTWRLFEPKQFSIEPRLSSIGALYPGAPALPLPVVLHNPNPVPILITALRVAATASAPGCDSATNLELIPASASVAAPLTVPPGGALSLPAPGASPPAIGLRDLPVNQDACQGASFPLAFSGEAHG